MTDSNEIQTKATILVVDDTAANLSLMGGLLKELYQVKVANSGERGLAIAQSDTPPDLILLDIMMPEIDGYEVCMRLKKNPLTCDIPIIFLTAKSEIDDEQRGLELGAVDYITKPFSPPIVLARIRIHLALKASLDFLREQNTHLEIEGRKRAEHIMGMITGVVLHESDSDKLAEVILTLGGYLEKKIVRQFNTFMNIKTSSMPPFQSNLRQLN